MGRAAAEACMFCGSTHTGACGGKPKPAVVKRAPKASPPSVSPSAEAPGEIGPPEKTANFEPPPSRASARPDLSSVTRVRDDDDFGPALTVFADAGLMSKEDMTTHRGIISLPDHRIDALIWRQVNHEEVQRRGRGQ